MRRSLLVTLMLAISLTVGCGDKKGSDGTAGTGSAGTGSAGTGSAGTGSAGTGSAGTGSAGTGSAGTGSAGTGGGSGDLMASVEALCATLVTLDCPSQISEAQCVTDLYDGYSEDAESCPDEVNAFIACLAGKDASDFECNDELAWRKDGVCEAEDTVKDACEDGN